MDGWISLLDPLVSPSTEQFAIRTKKSCTHRHTAFIEPSARFLQRDGEHFHHAQFYTDPNRMTAPRRGGFQPPT